MLLTDALHAIETVGGVWLGISAVAFILLGLFAEIPENLRPSMSGSRRPANPLPTAGNSTSWRKAEKRPASKKAPARKAA